MAYPTIPLFGFWNNQIQHSPSFTLVQTNPGGVTSRNRSQLINAVRRSWSVQGNITNRDELDTFLRDRNGRPFGYVSDGLTHDGNYTCIDWAFTWLVYIVPEVGAPSGGWTFSATFIEDFNPQPTI